MDLHNLTFEGRHLTFLNKNSDEKQNCSNSLSLFFYKAFLKKD